jgi:hypothetical protein
MKPHHGNYYYYQNEIKKDGTLSLETNNGKSEENTQTASSNEMDVSYQGGIAETETQSEVTETPEG